MVVDTFNPSTWDSHTFKPNTKEEVETGRVMARQREEYKTLMAREGTRAQGFRLRTWRDPIPNTPFGLRSRGKNYLASLIF